MAAISIAAFFVLGMRATGRAQQRKDDTLLHAFVSPPDGIKPRVYWWWLFNRVDKAGITRDMEEFRAKGIGGYHDIWVQAFRVRGDTKEVDTASVIDITDRMQADGRLDWRTP